MRRTAGALALATALIIPLALSCDDSSSPMSVPDPTPSTLSLALGGGKAGGNALSLGGGTDAYCVQVSWTECPDADFAYYVLYRSQTAGIQDDPSVSDTSFVITEISETGHVDTRVEEGNTYHYALQTVNTADVAAWSNEESIDVPVTQPPDPAVLSGSYTGNVMWPQNSLSWTENSQEVFYSYVLYRSEEPGIEDDPSSARVMDVFYRPTEIAYEDNDLLGSTTYHYAIRTWDQHERCSWSNEIAVSVPEVPDLLTVFFIDPTEGSYSGDAILLRTPQGRSYLIDGGYWNGGWSCGEAKVLPLLDSLSISELDGMVGTHPHADHIGGLIAVLDSIPVGTVWDSGWPYGASWIYEDYLEAIVGNGADYVTPRRGDMLDWDDKLAVETLHPVEPLPSSNVNNSSVTLRVTFDQVSFLFTGDLETSGGENDIMDAVEDISADVLKVGHHGSNTSTSSAWLEAVDPDYGAIEVGAGNPYGHPHPTVTARLESYGVDILRTDLDGSFIIATDGTEIYVWE